MNRRQRERKRRKAHEHSHHQFNLKLHAIEASRSSKTGKPTKKGMEQYGYVPNGRGGWRPIIISKKVDNMAKE